MTSLLHDHSMQVPILALTATATHQVCQDLRTILRIEGCEFFRSSINRPTLYYELRHKPATAAETTADVVAWIRQHYNQVGATMARL